MSDKVDFSKVGDKNHPHNWWPTGVGRQGLGSAMYCKSEMRRGRWFAGCLELRWVKKEELEKSRTAWREYMDQAIPA